MKTTIQEKRESLKAISKIIAKAVEAEQFDSVNAGLVEMYKEQGHTEIHSFRRWLQLGYHVRKGETALLLWGQPRKVVNQEKVQENEKDEFSFFPLAFVFSQKQVEPLKELAR